MKYRICCWYDKKFDHVPNEVFYTDEGLNVAYDKFYEILSDEKVERIELYEIIDGEEELIDRMTAVN